MDGYEEHIKYFFATYLTSSKNYNAFLSLFGRFVTYFSHTYNDGVKCWSFWSLCGRQEGLTFNFFHFTNLKW